VRNKGSVSERKNRVRVRKKTKKVRVRENLRKREYKKVRTAVCVRENTKVSVREEQTDKERRECER
jgi:hypothetical protein